MNSAVEGESWLISVGKDVVWLRYATGSVKRISPYGNDVVPSAITLALEGCVCYWRLTLSPSRLFFLLSKELFPFSFSFFTFKIFSSFFSFICQSDSPPNHPFWPHWRGELYLVCIHFANTFKSLLVCTVCYCFRNILLFCFYNDHVLCRSTYRPVTLPSKYSFFEYHVSFASIAESNNNKNVINIHIFSSHTKNYMCAPHSTDTIAPCYRFAGRIWIRATSADGEQPTQVLISHYWSRNGHLGHVGR